MSKAYKCDRCGKLYELEPGGRVTFDGGPVVLLAVGSNDLYSVHSPFDICARCAVDFIYWWKDVKKDGN